ncbi:MAG TPA: methionine adenosyltransferase [Terriglobales bacterium]
MPSLAPITVNRCGRHTINLAQRQSCTLTGKTQIIERKGRGTPDTMCEVLATNLSSALSNFYLERFGVILRHEDKTLLGRLARCSIGCPVVCLTA